MTDTQQPTRGGRARRKVVLTSIVGVAAAVAIGVTATRGGDSATVTRMADRTPVASASEPAVEDELRVSTAGWSTDFTKHSVPLGEFFGGGPGKDGIPAIDDPVFATTAESAEYLEAREPVILVELNGEARIYPIQVLIWHEIVNDTLGGTPIAVTFCPLCNTALVFERTLDGQLLDFGTSGNLRNSDLVMFDRQTETWWQQFGGDGVVGELTGKKLTPVPAQLTAWEDARATHPDADVLSRDTGFSRPYGQNPYVGYDDIDRPPFFPVENEDDRLNPKDRVVFIEHEGEAVAVPLTALEVAGEIELAVGGRDIVVGFEEGVRSALDGAEIGSSRDVGSATARDASTGELVPFDTPFWFAVGAFAPDARIVEN